MSYCRYCEQKRKARTDGEWEYCEVCGSNLGPTGSTSLQF